MPVGFPTSVWSLNTVIIAIHLSQTRSSLLLSASWVCKPQGMLPSFLPAHYFCTLPILTPRVVPASSRTCGNSLTVSLGVGNRTSDFIFPGMQWDQNHSRKGQLGFTLLPQASSEIEGGPSDPSRHRKVLSFLGNLLCTGHSAGACSPGHLINHQ